ncbi:MAG TPA: SDR family oxidoreductase [Vicinamibacterales bacterium]
MILVAGASGTLGSAIVNRLLSSGRSVRVLTRDAERVQPLVAGGAAVAIGDITDRASIDRAMDGVTHVITTANAFIVPARDAVERVDVQGNRNLIDAAHAAGVRQFVFTSAWLPDEYLRIDYFAAKRRTEDYLRSSGVPYTILRPSAFMETWAMVIGEPILKTGATRIFGDGTNRVNFVAIDDVAAVAVRTLDHPDAINAVIDIFGPENLSLLDVAAVFERVNGSPARKQFLPVAVMKVLSRLVRPFNLVFARQVAAGALMATVPQEVDPASRGEWNVAMTRLEDWVRDRYTRS